MQLSANNLQNIGLKGNCVIPDKHISGLPEKVLQFGTGVLLRALPDYFIDKANRQGIFNGRVVVVKSTGSDSSAFDRQNGLYTVCVRGVENGTHVKENIINASISRVLSAQQQWAAVLECAHNPELKVVISNTTEVGIQLVDDDIRSQPPVSFPGKLLAFLYHRFLAFHGSPGSGMVIVPTELVTDNGTKLEKIVLELAHRNNLEIRFIEWLEKHNRFCNSLVDRIVPGKPRRVQYEQYVQELGYEDELLTTSEVFRLWAIEGDEAVKKALSFYMADSGMIIQPDIALFKELKLRLLNGTHTFNCGTAFLCGFGITRDAVTHPVYGEFTRKLMLEEIAPAIPFTIDEELKQRFALNTFERFCNPFIDHQWQSIAVQYTSKMNMRNLPLLVQHYKNQSRPPRRMVVAFAAFLLYMKAVRHENGRYFGLHNGVEYEIIDDAAWMFYEAWLNYPPAELVRHITADTRLWDARLDELPGFTAAVQEALESIMANGVMHVVAALQNKTVAA